MITRLWGRLDRFAFPLTVAFLIVVCLVTGPTLRQFSSFLSAVAFMALLWRVIGTAKQMDLLAFVLSLALAVNLATAAIAQYTLSAADGPPPPDNTLGITLVLCSRIFTLSVLASWNYWLIPRRTL